jgi:hypothetical protein
MSQPASIGDTTLQVGSTVGFTVGADILISGTEQATISSISSLNLVAPLQQNHAAGASVVMLTTAFAGGDPVTWYNGVKTKFWIPNGIRMPMLKSTDVEVWAKTIGGEPQDQAPMTGSGVWPKSEDLQWFEEIYLTLPDGTPVLSVSIKRTPSDSTRNPRDFQDINVVLGSSSSRLTVMSDLLFEAGGVKIGISHRLHPTRQENFEAVHVETPSLAFAIMPVLATAEFGNDMLLSHKYRHLDLIIMEMSSANVYEGVFPELWGTQPISPEVDAMKTAPSERHKPAYCLTTSSDSQCEPDAAAAF